jgi:MFS family permease
MRHNLRLIKLESIVTFFLLGAVETLYLQAEGYTLGQIGAASAIETAVILTANIPLGYLADKKSRKMCNLFGDALIAAGIIGFAFASNFALIIAAEVVIGVGFALSIGADSALLKAVCDKLGETYVKHSASATSIMVRVAVVNGIAIGLVTTYYDPTVGVLLTAVPYILGVIISCFIEEVKSSAKPKSIKQALVCCWKDKTILWAILTGGTLGSIAGITQNMAVPLAKTGGVFPLLASMAWACYFSAWSLGAWLFKRKVDVWPRRRLLSLPRVVIAAALITVAIDINQWTVIAFLVIGLAHGWMAPQLSATAIDRAPEGLQATVISIYLAATQLIFVLSSLVITNIATYNLGYAMTAAAILFGPPFLVGSAKLLRTV